MAIVGVLLVLLAPLALIVGLIFPRLFAGRAAEKPSRWRGAGIGTVALVAGVGMIIAFPDRDTTVIPAQQDTATNQATPPASPASPTDAEPVAAPAGTTPPSMTLVDYLAKCSKADDAKFAADCLGKRVEGVLYFGSPSADETKQMMAVPGNYQDIFWVTFAEVPDWGSKEPVVWTGRRETIEATIDNRSDNGGPVLKSARIVENDDWRQRAVEMVQARDGVLEAMWPHEGDSALWVVMRSNGQKRDADAEQFCSEVWRAGQGTDDWVVVTILDGTRLLQDEMTEMGKAYCR